MFELSRARLCANVHKVKDHHSSYIVGPPLDPSPQRLHQWGVPWVRPHLPAGQQRGG